MAAFSILITLRDLARVRSDGASVLEKEGVPLVMALEPTTLMLRGPCGKMEFRTLRGKVAASGAAGPVAGRESTLVSLAAEEGEGETASIPAVEMGAIFFFHCWTTVFWSW